MKRATDKKIKDLIKAKKVLQLLIAIHKGVTDEELRKLIAELRKKGESEVLSADLEDLRGSFKERVYKVAEEDMN